MLKEEYQHEIEYVLDRISMFENNIKNGCKNWSKEYSLQEIEYCKEYLNKLESMQ